MNVPLRFKKFILRLAFILMITAALACFGGMMLSSLDRWKETGLAVATWSLVMMITCMFFFIGRGARWEAEIKGQNPQKSIGAL